ncbi:FAD-dependent oxidoreductase [Candidatus Saccharibacteria bacterium]|nr:FAD-dependent oxidoreductase [Candidatus Saccharibacteria bacterium]
MSKTKFKALIVGGGFGGIKTALELSHDSRFSITVLTHKPTFRYYPSLYHTATGGSREATSIPIKDIFEDYPSVKVAIDSAKSIDREKKFILTESGEKYEYDVLVFALGMKTNYFGIPGLEKLAFGIKTNTEAERLKKHIHKHIINTKHPDLNYVVVGGGPSGVELAGVLGQYVKKVCSQHGVSKASVHVDLVEASPRLLPIMPKIVSSRVSRNLRKLGVKIYLNSAVKSLSDDELMVNDKPIRSHTVIWTAGTSNNEFFTNNGFQISGNRKVRVDQFLQAERGIYVIGDNADTPYSGLAQTALYDGRYIAENIIRLANDDYPIPYEAKRPVYVLPAGPNWAAVVWGRFYFFGRLGWWLRRAADFVAYRDYEPWFKATKHWFAEYKEEDLCPLCDQD